MNNLARSWIASFALFALSTTTALADDIVVIAGTGFAAPLRAVIPAFEGRTGHRIQVRYGTVPQLIKMSAEPFDLAITTSEPLKNEESGSRFVDGPAPVIAKVDIGVAVLKGATMPNIRTTAALKQTLLDAKAVSSIPASATGAKLTKNYENMGIAEQMKSKILAQPTAAEITEAVANGEADLAIFTLNVLMNDPRLAIVGPIPDDIQNPAVYVGAVSASTRVPVAVKALIDFLKSPEAMAVIKAQGLTPG